MKAADQFRPADVTRWGITALVVWGVAMLGANLSGLVPSGVFASLHSSRIEGATMGQLRAQVASLQAESARQRRDAAELLARHNMGEDLAASVTKRVGALEISLPKLVEQQLASAGLQKVDPVATGSIDQPITYEVDGGLVQVRQVPLVPGSEVRFKATPLAAAMPDEIVPGGSAMGVALGFPVTPEEAGPAWQGMLADAGTMLLGLKPVLSVADGTTNKLIVAGPITDRASALDLCKRLDQQGIVCQALPYAGEPLPLLN